MQRDGCEYGKYIKQQRRGRANYDQVHLLSKDGLCLNIRNQIQRHPGNDQAVGKCNMKPKPGAMINDDE